MRNPHSRDHLIGDLGIAVRAHLRYAFPPGRIQALQHLLQLGPRTGDTAVKAFDSVEAAVQIDDVPVAGALMQPVDVLGRQQGDVARYLQADQGVVGTIWSAGSDIAPAGHTARPVAAPGFLALDKVPVLNRVAALPFAPVIPVGRDT